ncbi:hypothetical protein QK289_15845 [Exiguobacterium antarcticum]|uniref:Uncharacterized protein n=1 Tax=Exiguobacterium antarcticum TaxID=132920 RepID=A0ABT6R6M8_9BACL|nr:hypothetical protein [Exiguobacterium antarcticum]MDI3236485.1 hypothetical protein [Exiguobacterium antarcticum]
MMHATVTVGIKIKEDQKSIQRKQYFTLPQQKDLFFNALETYGINDQMEPVDLEIKKEDEFVEKWSNVIVDYRELEKLSKDVYCATSVTEIQEQLEIFVECI